MGGGNRREALVSIARRAILFRFRKRERTPRDLA